MEMYYYAWLIVIGNDVNPTTYQETIFCTIVIFFGAFLEAYLIGAITAELMKTEDRNLYISKMVEYAKYSLDIHKLSNNLTCKIISYLNQIGENNEITNLREFLNVINPSLRYEVI